jgi:hypothetical protein
LVHALPAVQLPDTLQVSGWLELEQLVWPGAHTPEHAPFTQVVLVHAVVVVLHVPLVVQLATPLPEHVVCPGAHTPVHAPPMHVWLEHAVAVVFQVPLAEQVSTPLPEHVV